MLEGLKKELLLSEILPNENKNTQYVNTLIEKFVTLGLNKDSLDKLFGVESEPDLEYILDVLLSSYQTLENTQQVAYVCLRCDINKRKRFKIKLSDSSTYEFNRQWYIKNYSFINESHITQGYSDLAEYIKLPFDTDDVLVGPYIKDKEFICPGLKLNLSDSELIDLLNYIRDTFTLEKITSVDWSQINLNVKEWIYPFDYAIESEKMPKCILDWLEETSKNKSVLVAMGLSSEDSPIVKIRKYFKGDSQLFKNEWLYAILALISINYILYYYETMFTIPLAIGVCALLFSYKRLDKEERIYYYFLVASGMLFLLLYAVLVLPKVETFYAHHLNVSPFANAAKMFFAFLFPH
jgi:hypothetical protein